MFREQGVASCKWPGMFIRNERARKETPMAFLSFLDRITKLMDRGSVLVVKYLGLESLLM